MLIGCGGVLVAGVCLLGLVLGGLFGCLFIFGYVITALYVRFRLLVRVVVVWVLLLFVVVVGLAGLSF